MSQNQLSVGVLMGGTSSEHDVSMETGRVILNHLDRREFNPFPIIIDKKNYWRWPQSKTWPPNTPLPSEQNEDLKNWDRIPFPIFSQFPSCDIMFIGLHGKGGEDGTLQGFLDLCKQKYTGSGALGSGLAMDKSISKKILENNNIPTPHYQILQLSDTPKIEELSNQNFPLVLKDPLGGSSLGVSLVHSPEEFRQALDEFKKNCHHIVVEEYIRGREATCGYIANYKDLSPTEIIPDQDVFFNYKAKYNGARTREITPGNFTPERTKKMQDLARKCHNVHQLEVYSRTDFLLRNDELFVLEINSLPGLTNESLLPKSAAHSGLNYQALLSKILHESLRK